MLSAILELHMNFLKKYPFIFLLFSPLLFYVTSQIMMLPSVLIAALFFTDSCEGKGDLCMLGPTIAVILFINILLAYLLALFIYKIVSKPTNVQLIKTSLLLAIYFVLVFGGAYAYDFNKRTSRSTERANVHALESGLTVNDLSITQRNSIRDPSLSDEYLTDRGIVFRYPADFELADHQAPSNYYLRTYNSEYLADRTTTMNNNRFIGVTIIDFNTDYSVSTDQEAMQYLLDIAQRYFVPIEHPVVYKKTVDTAIMDDGKKIYYLERGAFDKNDQRYSEMYVLVDTGNAQYYSFKTYTTFFEGNALTKKVLENSVFN